MALKRCNIVRVLNCCTATMIVVPLLFLSTKHLMLWGVGLHQKAITQELAEWEQEFARIENREDAYRAIDMMAYIEDYYVPGPGYRAHQQTEEALNDQRHETLVGIVLALEAYTGELHGFDRQRWEQWREMHTGPEVTE